MEDVLLMRHTGWTWRELQETPVDVVLRVSADLAARGWAEEEKSRWAERDARAARGPGS